MSRRVVAGIGIRPDCTAAEIAALVRRATELAAEPPDHLALPCFRRSFAAELQALLSLPVLVVERAALAAAQGRCATRSARAEAATGFASVAEGCALAAAGPGARLLLPRIASANATCALAKEDTPG